MAKSDGRVPGKVRSAHGRTSKCWSMSTKRMFDLDRERERDNASTEGVGSVPESGTLESEVITQTSQSRKATTCAAWATTRPNYKLNSRRTRRKST
jgi:hypothetical protein